MFFPTRTHHHHRHHHHGPHRGQRKLLVIDSGKKMSHETRVEISSKATQKLRKATQNDALRRDTLFSRSISVVLI